MEENNILLNTIGGGNEWRGGTVTMAALIVGQQQGAVWGGYMMVSADGGRENVWASSDYTGVLEKILKCKADVGGESTKRATFKIQAAEAEIFWVFVSMVKGEIGCRMD